MVKTSPTSRLGTVSQEVSLRRVMITKIILNTGSETFPYVVMRACHCSAPTPPSSRGCPGQPSKYRKQDFRGAFPFGVHPSSTFIRRSEMLVKVKGRRERRRLTSTSVISCEWGGWGGWEKRRGFFKDQKGDVPQPILRHTGLNHNHRNGC